MVIFGGRGGEKTGFLLPYPNKLILTFYNLGSIKSKWLVEGCSCVEHAEHLIRMGRGSVNSVLIAFESHSEQVSHICDLCSIKRR